MDFLAGGSEHGRELCLQAGGLGLQGDAELGTGSPNPMGLLQALRSPCMAVSCAETVISPLAQQLLSILLSAMSIILHCGSIGHNGTSGRQLVILCPV